MIEPQKALEAVKNSLTGIYICTAYSKDDLEWSHYATKKGKPSPSAFLEMQRILEEVAKQHAPELLAPMLRYAVGQFAVLILMKIGQYHAPSTEGEAVTIEFFAKGKGDKKELVVKKDGQNVTEQTLSLIISALSDAT